MTADVTNRAGERIALSISGMTCGGCANTVKRVLSQVPGVTATEVDLGAGTALVEGTARPQQLVDAVEAAGFGAALRA
jgi:copper chaperone CopZ